MAHHSVTALIRSALVSATLSVALLTLAYIFLLPTSDLRTRVYIIDGLGPTVSLLLFAFFILVSLLAVWASGWLNRWGVIGVPVGAVIALLLFWSRTLGLIVWRYDPEVTLAGQITRAAVVVTVAAAATVALRRRARVAA